MMRPRAWVVMIIGGLFALCAAFAAFGDLDHSLARQAASSPVAPPVITSEVLGAATPAAVDHPELALGRVTIMPGAVIPVHYHPGTQIGAIVQGELTYTVLSGSVLLYRADGAGDPEIVGAGETVVALPGDVLVEPPGEHHQGGNAGTTPVVIYLSTLFPAGSPRSIIVEATPVR